jgi:resorcinol 4-hydroxylase (FADH2)
VIALAPTHRRNPRLPAAAQDPHAHMLLGQAEGALQAARAFVVDAFSDAWSTVEFGDPIGADRTARIDLALRQAMTAALHAADLVSGLAGAAIVQIEHPLGRAIRDLRAAGQHIGLRSDGFADYAHHVLDRHAGPLPGVAS